MAEELNKCQKLNSTGCKEEDGSNKRCGAFHNWDISNRNKLFFIIENISIPASEIQPHQKRSIVSILYEGSDVKCSGNIIHESVILTWGPCIEDMNISKLRIKLYNSSEVSIGRISTTSDQKIALVLINTPDHLKESMDVLPLVKSSDQKLEGPVTLLGWYNHYLENVQSLNSASFELTEVEKSLCSEKMSIKKLDEYDVCARLPHSRVNLSQFYPIGAPIVQDGIQIGILATIDVENLLLLYRKIDKYRHDIVLLMKMYKLSQMPEHIYLNKTKNDKDSHGYQSVQYWVVGE
ncbi:hypothetical protein QAD02_010148 [Eretmocerus hayati]|uniref:Uncharacterized protein n=1 Tax=Eretmocerus hayati TaxID=131215 RepID=A0ACC2NBE0_9HYME|nr:hypothetical protein QAD02_010148 [Eretmocerus hayati]